VAEHLLDVLQVGAGRVGKGRRAVRVWAIHRALLASADSHAVTGWINTYVEVE
jgi:hypothetical protein